MDTRAIGADWRFVCEELSIMGIPFLNPIDRLSAGIRAWFGGVGAIPRAVIGGVLGGFGLGLGGGYYGGQLGGGAVNFIMVAKSYRYGVIF